MGTLLDQAARFLHQLHQRVKAIRLQSERSINDHSQRIPLSQLLLISLPFVVRDSFILRIFDHGQVMFPA